jgi:Ca2+-binding RTX toxin-like protein
MSASATTVWNAFQLGDNAALFGTLLIANDRVTGSTQNDTLGGYHGNDTVNGGTGADRVSGGAGADNLNGGDGDDVMNGGDAGDRMTGGIGLDRLTGGAGDDLLKGEADDDKVLGSAGMDTLAGGAGNDVLTGGGGKDQFRFEDKGVDADRINDFTDGTDQIAFDLDFFSRLNNTGALNPVMFKAGSDISAAGGADVDADDRILYDTDSGRLYYDTNGSDAGGRFLVATVVDTPGTHPLLDAGDFRVVA